MPKIYSGSTEITGPIYFGSQALAKVYAGSSLVWQSGGGTDTLSMAVIGDSTISNYSGTAIAQLIAGITPTDISTAGDTIGQQLSRWKALPNHVFEAVVMQIGLNNVTGSGTAALAITALQELVDKVRLDAGALCKIYVAKMLPCKQRWIDLYGGPGGATAQAQWVDINDAIAGAGATPITGVDGRITSHVPLLDDGSGNLAAAYDSGDHIHENNAGRHT
jgi:hypothetical protein